MLQNPGIIHELQNKTPKYASIDIIEQLMKLKIDYKLTIQVKFYIEHLIPNFNMPLTLLSTERHKFYLK